MKPVLRGIPLFFLCVFLGNPAANAQSGKGRTKDFPAIALELHQGRVLPTNPFVQGDNLLGKPINSYRSISLKMLWQNPGYTEWQRVYRAPYYGFGFFTADFYDPEELGNPLSVYGVLGVPVKRFKKLEIYSEFQFGLAFNWKKYDSITNPKNLAIGGGMTVHLDIALKAAYPLNSWLDLGAGLSFSHFSNGGFERPNRGLNLISPTVELKAHLAGRPDVRCTSRPEKSPHGGELYLMLGYGDHQLVEHELDTNYFNVGGLSAIYLFQHTHAFKSGPGIDANFWWGLTAANNGTPGPVGLDNLTIGAIYQFEFAIGHLSLNGGVGNYLRHRNYGNFKQFYQRLGARYYLTDRISLGVNVRSINFILAEFLEFNLGYRIKWKGVRS